MLHLKFKLRFILTVLFLLALLLFFAYPLSAQSAEGKVRVAANNCPPFVINDNDQFSGISIFLWDKIAEQLGLDYSIEQYGLKEMLEKVLTVLKHLVLFSPAANFLLRGIDFFKA